MQEEQDLKRHIPPCSFDVSKEIMPLFTDQEISDGKYLSNSFKLLTLYNAFMYLFISLIESTHVLRTLYVPDTTNIVMSKTCTLPRKPPRLVGKIIINQNDKF